MSTLRMLKDHKRGKKGEVVTVPFLEARELVKEGVAERPGDMQAVPPPTDLAASAVIAEAVAEVAEVKTEPEPPVKRRRRFN